MASEAPNVLLIGASGGVASAFLLKIAGERRRFHRLVLVDPHDGLLQNAYIPHETLHYDFREAFIDVKGDPDAYLRLIEENDIDLVIDLSVNETRPMLEATDSLGARYINTGIVNRKGEDFYGVVVDLHSRREKGWHAPHILCSGMNPGVVNAWVRAGIERFGRPERIVHFEWDTAQPSDGWAPLITWSRETLLDEIVNDPAGYMEGRDRPVLIPPNPLMNRVGMDDVLGPIMDLDEYPRGFLLLHEENVTLAQSYDLPSRFLFAIHPGTMDHLVTVYTRSGTVAVNDIGLGDNNTVSLIGRAVVGVLLEYARRKVYFVNALSHAAFRGCSASCWQVAAGLHAAVRTILEGGLPGMVYFPEDLYGTSYGNIVSESLTMQETVIETPH